MGERRGILAKRSRARSQRGERPRFIPEVIGSYGKFLGKALLSLQ